MNDDLRQQRMLAEMGLTVRWTRREPVEAPAPSPELVSVVPAAALTPVSPAGEPVTTPPQATHPPHPDVSQLDWQGLTQAVAQCRACGLCEGRANTVFGTGDPNASWMFIGEGPGRQEDSQGDPFVGPAGKLLDSMLRALGLARHANVYIANIVKCRPVADGRDRPPTAEEAAVCLPFLERQIELVQPDVIVALGKTAAISLLKLAPDTPVASLRGKPHRYRDRPLVVTYHPAYLLRQPADKAKAWRDLCLAMELHAAGQ